MYQWPKKRSIYMHYGRFDVLNPYIFEILLKKLLFKPKLKKQHPSYGKENELHYNILLQSQIKKTFQRLKEWCARIL